MTCGATSVTVPCIPSFAIGDTGPAGGIVFYVTDGGLHGMEAAPVDQGSSVWGQWGPDGCPYWLYADGMAIGTGAQNTAKIIAGCQEAGSAARLAYDYSLGGFDDWFLPSKWELHELYLNRAVVGGLAYGYWSSSEAIPWFSENSAWYQDFSLGWLDQNPKHFTYRVRAVRAF